MDNILIESLYELNSIITECNSTIIYESIMLESEEGDVIDVEYRNTDEKYKKKNKILEKVKAVWKAFVATMKKMMKACINFIKKNVKMIKETSEVKVAVIDRSELIEGLKQLNADTKSKVVFKKIYDSGSNPYTLKFMHQEPRVTLMSKSDAIKVLEKQLHEANKLIEEFDKMVDELLEYYDDVKDTMDPLSRITNEAKVKLVSSSRESFRRLINHIVEDIEEITAKKRDAKK